MNLVDDLRPSAGGLVARAKRNTDREGAVGGTSDLDLGLLYSVALV